MLEDSGGLRGTGLEIGAATRPTVWGPGIDLKILDFFSTEELRKNVAKNGGDPDAVVPVDYVAHGEDYRSCVDRQFNYIIANHVFEHIINPIAWLQMLGELLAPGGFLLLTIPDRTDRCFDRFRDPTPLSHLVWDYISDLTQEQKAKVHAYETNLYYDRSYINQTVTPEQLFEIENIKRAQYHPGVHCHVFLSGTFLWKAPS